MSIKKNSAWFASIILLWSAQTLPAATQVSTLCVGPRDARAHAVYLHGRDTEPPGELEQQNRDVIAQLAENLQMRIAIPRAREFCPGGAPVCWGVGMTISQAKSALKIVRQAASDCFGSRRSYGLIGFSSGGYVAQKIYRSCMSTTGVHRIPWFVTIGSGDVTEPVSRWAPDLSQCGRLTLIVGRNDSENYRPGFRFIAGVRRRGGQARLLEFEGDHFVPLEPTQQAVGELTSSQ